MLQILTELKSLCFGRRKPGQNQVCTTMTQSYHNRTCLPTNGVCRHFQPPKTEDMKITSYYNVIQNSLQYQNSAAVMAAPNGGQQAMGRLTVRMLKRS